MYNQNKIEGFEISTNNKSKRIVEFYLKDDFIEKLIFPFKRFDITALEYKPVTKFTLEKMPVYHIIDEEKKKEAS